MANRRDRNTTTPVPPPPKRAKPEFPYQFSRTEPLSGPSDCSYQFTQTKPVHGPTLARTTPSEAPIPGRYMSKRGRTALAPIAPQRNPDPNRNWNPNSTSTKPPGDAQFLLDENTKMLTRIVANHYSGRTNQTLEERETSTIIHLKKFNNWIKSVLIQLYAKNGDAVLDLACGKGGDLMKWDKAKICYYVGIDIAEGSIEDCCTRYNGDANQLQHRRKFSFPARLICGDCFEVPLDRVLADDAPFDICSCQFAMHYSWSSESRARRALANISAILRPGGIFIGTMPDANVIIKKLRQVEGLEFGNSVYWIQFDEEYSEKEFKSSNPFGIKYKFHLEDAVDCPEWIVPFHVFKSLAEEYDLELVFVKNSHAFADEYLKKPEYVELMRRLGALGDGNQNQNTLSPDEWEAAYLYLAFVLRKRGQPDQSRTSRRQDRGKLHLLKEDITYVSSGF